MDTSQAMTFELPHISLAGVSWGDKTKPLILALHGWLDNAASFQPLAPYIDDYYVIALDWPGHGLSGHRPVGANYQLLDYVYDLYCLIKTEQWQQVHIVAHSLGAIVSSIFCATFPELVNRLVLIEALGPITATAEQTNDNIKKSAIAQFKQLTRTKPIHPTFESAVNARKNAGDFSHDIAKILVKRGLMVTEGGFTWRSDMRLNIHSPWRMMQEQAEHLMENLTTRTLIIVASAGLPMVKIGLEQRRHLIEQLDVVELDGGHHVHMEQPHLTWQAIKAHFELGE